MIARHVSGFCSFVQNQKCCDFPSSCWGLVFSVSPTFTFVQMSFFSSLLISIKPVVLLAHTPLFLRKIVTAQCSLCGSEVWWSKLCAQVNSFVPMNCDQDKSPNQEGSNYGETQRSSIRTEEERLAAEATMTYAVSIRTGQPPLPSGFSYASLTTSPTTQEKNDDPDSEENNSRNFIINNVLTGCGGMSFRRMACKARSVPEGHRPENAFFVIPNHAEHGMSLTCSHPLCERNKFRYCKVCDMPVARRNFPRRHHHEDYFLEQRQTQLSSSSPSAENTTQDGDTNTDDKSNTKKHRLHASADDDENDVVIEPDSVRRIDHDTPTTKVSQSSQSNSNAQRTELPSSVFQPSASSPTNSLSSKREHEVTVPTNTALFPDRTPSLSLEKMKMRLEEPLTSWMDISSKTAHSFDCSSSGGASRAANSVQTDPHGYRVQRPHRKRQIPDEKDFFTVPRSSVSVSGEIRKPRSFRGLGDDIASLIQLHRSTWEREAPRKVGKMQGSFSARSFMGDNGVFSSFTKNDASSASEGPADTQQNDDINDWELDAHNYETTAANEVDRASNYSNQHNRVRYTDSRSHPTIPKDPSDQLEEVKSTSFPVSCKEPSLGTDTTKKSCSSSGTAATTSAISLIPLHTNTTNREGNQSDQFADNYTVSTATLPILSQTMVTREGKILNERESRWLQLLYNRPLGTDSENFKTWLENVVAASDVGTKWMILHLGKPCLTWSPLIGFLPQTTFLDSVLDKIDSVLDHRWSKSTWRTDWKFCDYLSETALEYCQRM